MTRLALAVLVALGVRCSAGSPEAPPAPAPPAPAEPVREAPAPAAPVREAPAPAAPVREAPAPAEPAPSAPTGLAAAEPDGPPAPLTTDAIADGPSCARAGYVAPAGARPELRHRARGSVLEIGLHNAGSEPVCMYVYIATHELQHDWLTVEYADGANYHHFSRVLHFDDDREKSAPIARDIAPGATFWLGFDLQAWARRPRNHSEPIRPGDLYTRAIYANPADDRAWRGRLERVFSMPMP